MFHPQFLSQSILAGKTTLVRRVLVALNKVLKYHVAGEVIDDYLAMDVGEFYLSPVSCSRYVAGIAVLTCRDRNHKPRPSRKVRDPTSMAPSPTIKMKTSSPSRLQWPSTED